MQKTFRGNLNEAISANEIALFRFPWKRILKRKLHLNSYQRSWSILVNSNDCSSNYLDSIWPFFKNYYYAGLFHKKATSFRIDFKYSAKTLKLASAIF